ncbi:MAG: glycoside hydrolase family 16 protein [Nocardioides sp.]
MLSTPKLIASVASLALVSAGVAATAGGSSSAAGIPALQRKAAVTVSIVPGIIGPGSGLQSANAAKWAVIGKYAATKAGKKVVLQRQSGTAWQTADKSVIGTNGQVVFAVSGKPGVSYRVDGPGAASTPVSTDQWGTDADFVDNFSGSRLDLTQWQHRQGFYEPDSRRTCAKGDPKAVKVGRGTAQLSVSVDKTRKTLCKPPKPNNPNKIFGKFKWRLNANIGTQQTNSITYGVVAARMKFQALQGQHASLWMQPTTLNDSKNPADAGTEIDIIEWFGKDTPGGGLTSFIYAPSYQGKKIPLGGQGGFIRHPEQYLTSEKDDWYKRYHVFSVEWNPQGYIFRIDGQETGRINKGISAVPEYPILSLLSSDYELKKIGDEKNLPQTMNVDWIRTWQDPAHYTPPTPAP